MNTNHTKYSDFDHENLCAILRHLLSAGSMRKPDRCSASGSINRHLTYLTSSSIDLDRSLTIMHHIVIIVNKGVHFYHDSPSAILVGAQEEV